MGLGLGRGLLGLELGWGVGLKLGHGLAFGRGAWALEFGLGV